MATVVFGGGGKLRRLLGASSWGHHWQQRVNFVDGVTVRWIRDRGLDHAVEKEKHLLPFLHLKDFLVLSSHSSPDGCSLSSIRENLSFPFRPIEFIRLFPSAFTETRSSSTVPTIRPTPELLRLHQDELSLYDSSRDDAADRLLRLLMLSRTRSLSLDLLRLLRLDLGLPHDFSLSLLPNYPHYFHINPDSSHLDLVCWDRGLAVSAFQRRHHTATAFPQHFSQGFVMDKKLSRWMQEWQKLPYLSPYNVDGTGLDSKTPTGEKWAVGVLHELLHLLVPKKTGRDVLLLLADLVGLPVSACKKLLSNYPGIFYVSNKNNMFTVVLREAYRRGVLVEMHPLMEMRNKYIHLMRKPPVEESDSKKVLKERSRKTVAANNPVLHKDIKDQGTDGEEAEDDEFDDDDEEEEDDEEVEEDDDEDEEDVEGVPPEKDSANAVNAKTSREVIRDGSLGMVRGHRARKDSSVQLSSITGRLRTCKPLRDPRKMKLKMPHRHGSKPTTGFQASHVHNARRRPMRNART